MGGKPWTTTEEQLIIDNAGLLNLRDMARLLGRNYGAVKRHAGIMRAQGRFDKPLRLEDTDEFISYLKECPTCHTQRKRLNADGICRVCELKESLTRYEKAMHRAYDNLPDEFKSRTSGVFTPQRAPKLMTKSLKLKRPSVPDTRDMDSFEAAKAMDAWYRELEAYEVALVQLDIDAVKQRTCKWRRKTRNYLRNHKN